LTITDIPHRFASGLNGVKQLLSRVFWHQTAPERAAGQGNGGDNPLRSGLGGPDQPHPGISSLHGEVVLGSALLNVQHEFGRVLLQFADSN